MKYIDRFLNSITMYRLVLYGLFFIAFCGVILGFSGKIYYTGQQLLMSAVFLPLFCFLINYGFTKYLKAPSTIESSLITGLILFCIMQPAENISQLSILFLISLVAISSKYFIAINRKHIFNPAAFSAVVFGFTKFGAVWWISNFYMLFPVLIAGLLVVRKIKRFPLFIACIIGFFTSYLTTNGFSDLSDSISGAFISWPLLFFASIMLTEPSTLIPRARNRVIYGFIAGLFLGFPVKIMGNLYTTPEVVLFFGNIVAFLVSLKGKIIMVFQEKKELAKDCYEFIFKPDKRFAFKSGQYMEWSLLHKHQDLRGIRRYFTISSSPNNSYVNIGVRISKNSSTFKKNLMALKKGDIVYASQLDGDFVLSKDKSKKFAFIAGGIGITPFISMIGDLMDKNQKVDIILFYANKTSDIAYMDLLKSSEKIGVKTFYIMDKESHLEGVDSEEGPIGEDLIKRLAPDFKERTFYLSGPNAMVDNYKSLIQRMGVLRFNIKTDYFPGY